MRSRIRIEASSQCQLRCPSCPTTTQAIQPAVGSGFLKLADFIALLDANPHVREIELSNYGEIFLNPDLPGILKAAHARGVALSCANGANFNSVKREVLEGLVIYGFKDLTCSLDGASSESYARYRRHGNFEAVLANIRELKRLKGLHRSETPRLTWQFIAFGHNQHEIAQARAMAAELGMQFFLKLSWDPDFSPLNDNEALRSEHGVFASRREYEEAFAQPRTIPSTFTTSSGTTPTRSTGTGGSWDAAEISGAISAPRRNAFRDGWPTEANLE